MNRMATSIQKMEAVLPRSWHWVGYTFAFNGLVKLAATSGLCVEDLSATRSVVSLRNRRRVRNHIGGLHACSMALAAESATGLLLGMNVPDTHLPLLKRMEIDYVRRCSGGIRATAALSEEDAERIRTSDRGDVTVPCTVVDESGNEPVRATMVWAWTPKKKKEAKE
jgi:acyl-coenzyme A thioesterase PaaI-like protein